MWNIAERDVRARPGKVCEDAIYAAEDGSCFAVLDGISTHNGRTYEGLTPGQFAVQAGIAALKKAAAYVEPIPFATFLCIDVDSAFKRAGVPADERPGFVMAAFLPHQNTIVRIGDCSYLIDGAGENRGMRIDDAKARLRRRFVQKALSEGRSEEDLRAHDPSQECMRVLARSQCRFRNTVGPKGFAVIDGSRVPYSLIEYINVPKTARSIVLASDGYPATALAETLDETEQKMRELFVRDPLLTKEWPSVRPLPPGADRADDTAYLRVVSH